MKTVASPIIRKLKNKKKEKNDPTSGEDIRNVSDDYLFSEAAHTQTKKTTTKKKPKSYKFIVPITM